MAAQQADLADRAMEVREQQAAVVTDEVLTVRPYRQESLDYMLSGSRVYQTEHAIDLQRDVAAARLGVTRDQYDRLYEARWKESSTGWR